jgi:DnaK suppressor protein
MPTMGRSPHKKYDMLEKQLTLQRNELRIRIHRHRMDVVTDREPDDVVAAACENASRDLLVASLERERRTLQEIELALIRMEKGEYGTCDGCGAAIPKARLDALPWARLCIGCADRALNPNGLRAAS